MSQVPETMKAWVFRKTGQPKDVLKLETDYPVPVPKAGEILVKVHAVSLNSMGYRALTEVPLRLLAHAPGIPESDVSGVVVGGDLAGTGFKEGQEVFGIADVFPGIKSGSGTLAEYAVVRTLVSKPSNISHAEASGFPLAGLTAWQMLATAGLKKGDHKRVFVNGGSGGVGAWAVQIAKEFGVYVVSTASPHSVPLLKSLGADETVDYRAVTPSLPAYLSSVYPSSSPDKGFDIIADAVGTPSLYRGSPGFLKKDGFYVDVGAPHFTSWGVVFKTLFGALWRSRPRILGGTPRKYQLDRLNVDSMRAALKEAAEWLKEGRMKPVVDNVFAFEETIAAYERIMSGRAKGKVVIAVVPA